MKIYYRTYYLITMGLVYKSIKNMFREWSNAWKFKNNTITNKSGVKKKVEMSFVAPLRNASGKKQTNEPTDSAITKYHSLGGL